MITPEKITDYNRTEADLEEFLLFAILVAGKKASTTAKKLDSFLVGRITNSPFQFLQGFIEQEKEGHQVLDGWMRGHRLGQYKRLNSAFRGVLQFKGRLKDVTAEELESVKGIGPKTSRFFILHSRPDQNVACLDTHILKWMKSKGYDVPKTTPSKKRYKKIESDFIHECHKVGKKVADMDLEIWKSYAK
jgi:thermostable 8-oxoguanine DNA glycosylase